MSIIQGTNEYVHEDLEGLVLEEIARRKLGTVAGTGVGGSLAAESLRSTIHQQASKGLRDEWNDIRKDPALAARNMDQMRRTYQKYLEKTNNPVEYIVDLPNRDMWAAGRLPTGEDVVYIDSTAPHPAVLAHELGHVDMNHSSDPLAYLQTSGIGRASGNNAFLLGGAGAALGALTARYKARNRNLSAGEALKNQAIGSAIGTGVGAIGSSGMAAYEAEASRRALGYLPDDVSTLDAMGDLGRAHSTYLMGGPGEALVTGLGVGSALAAAAHPTTRKYARQAIDRALENLNAPGKNNTTVAGTPVMPNNGRVDGII